MSRIYLSPPHLMGEELPLVSEAIASNWIAPQGPMVDRFESEFATTVGARHAVALSSGTAALHLALLHLGVQAGDEVVTSTLTFAASAFPIRYLGARPVFVDASPDSWNLDPELLSTWMEQRARAQRLPRAVVLVHLYGQCADLDPIAAICAQWGVALVEDAAESLGSTYHGQPPGRAAAAAAWSFNGNKMITTSGGGMLTTDDPLLAAHARKLASQAREPVVHYEHQEIGFNYRLSNVSAALGIAQLAGLEARLAARRRNCEHYAAALADLPGLAFAPEMSWGRHARWLTCCTIDPAVSGIEREAVRLALEAEDIESRPVWKPLHRQPVFDGCEAVGGAVAERLFATGLCLPSGSQMTNQDLDRVVAVVRRAFEEAR